MAICIDTQSNTLKLNQCFNSIFSKAKNVYEEIK